jgi:2-polyprenyl-3-methyl-5-hydroxy-6-metoxy-1,4-benzoquinol methylase
MIDNVVEDYGWSGSAGPQSCGYVSPRVRAILRDLGVVRVLDAGCGNGALCGELAAEGYDVVGLEYDAKGVDVARLTHPSMRFYQLGLQDDPQQLLEHETLFDAVVSTEVVEHLFSPHLLPLFARECLRKGGYLIVSTPYHGYVKNLAISLANKWDAHHGPLWHGGHIKFWSPATLGQLLADHGFRVIRFAGVGRLPYLWKSMILVAAKT